MLSTLCVFFFFKQKTAYEMRISDWSSDVCSSDLHAGPRDSTVACFGDQHMRATPRSNLRAVRHDQKLVLLGQSGQPIPNGGRHRSAQATVDSIEDHRISPAFLGKRDLQRTEERRVGKECVSTGRTRWS